MAQVSLLGTIGDGVGDTGNFLELRMKNRLQHRIEWIIYVVMAVVLVCLIGSIFIIIILE